MLSDDQKDCAYNKGRSKYLKDNPEFVYGAHIAGLQAVAEAAVKDAVGGEVVAEVDHGKTQEIDWLVDPESLPVGTKLYTRPQNIISMPTSDEIKSSVDVLERNRNSDWGKAASEWANRPQASAASQPAAVVELTDADILNAMRDGYGCRENDWQDHINFARAIIARQGGAD